MTTRFPYFPGEITDLHLVEPRHRLMLKECFKDGEGEGYVGLLKRRHVIDASLGETEWRGEDIGCAAKIVTVGKLDEGSDRVTRTSLSIQGVRRFRVLDHHRTSFGYWVAHVDDVEDTEDAESKLCIQAVVRELFWEYAKEVTLDMDELVAYKNRLQFVAQQSPESFSFWAARQLKAAVVDSSVDRNICQKLLEIRNTRTRLELISKTLSEVMKEIQFKIPFNMLQAAGANPKPKQQDAIATLE